jgi:hypothetical protein
LTGPIKVSCHTIGTDLIAAGVNPADIDGQSTAMLFAPWKKLSTESGETSKWEGENPGVDLARPVK